MGYLSNGVAPLYVQRRGNAARQWQILTISVAVANACIKRTASASNLIKAIGVVLPELSHAHATQRRLVVLVEKISDIKVQGE